MPGLKTWRGASHEKLSAAVGYAFLGHLTGMVSWGVSALVGVLVLLVDYDHLQVGERGEDGASCSYHKAHLGALYLPPLGYPLGVGKTGVENGNIVVEPLQDLKGKLMGKCYLGNKIDHLSAVFYYLLRTAQEDLRLSRACHAEEVVHHGRTLHDCLDRILLFLREHHIGALHGLVRIKGSEAGVPPASGDHGVQDLAAA